MSRIVRARMLISSLLVLTIAQLVGFLLGANLAGVKTRTPADAATVSDNEFAKRPATTADGNSEHLPDAVAAKQARMFGLVILVCLLNATVMWWWIKMLTLPVRSLAVLVFLVFISCMTVMPQIETSFFLKHPLPIVRMSLIMGLCVSAIFTAGAVILVLRTRQISGQAVPRRVRWEHLARLGPWGFIWRVGASALIYCAIYLLFGYFVAWQNPRLRLFYGGSDSSPVGFWAMMTTAPVATMIIPLQLARGVLWTAICWLMVRHAQGSRPVMAICVSLVLAVVMNAQLLLPNPIMPAEIRYIHLAETAAANFIFGLVCVLTLSARRKADSAEPT